MQTVEKIDVNVDPVKVEDCHWVKTRGSKKGIVKFFTRKDANKIRAERKAEG